MPTDSAIALHLTKLELSAEHESADNLLTTTLSGVKL